MLAQINLNDTVIDKVEHIQVLLVEPKVEKAKEQKVEEVSVRLMNRDESGMFERDIDQESQIVETKRSL